MLDANIRRYLEDENTYTEKIMAPSLGLRKQLFKELKSRLQEDDMSVPDCDGPFAYYIRYVRNQQHPIFYRRPSHHPEPETILYDCNLAAQQHDYFSCSDCSHSPDHRYLAYCIDTQGGESYTLRIRDLESGQELDDRILNIQGALEWCADSRSIVYTTLDENRRPDRVCLHRIGDDPAVTKLYIKNTTLVFSSL